MSVSRVALLTLGVVAVASGITLLTFDVLFAARLTNLHSSGHTGVISIVAAVISFLAVAMLIVLFVRQVRHRNGVQDVGHGLQYTYIFAGLGAAFCLLSAAANALLFGLVVSGRVGVPVMYGRVSIHNLAIGGFIDWSLYLVLTKVFIISVVLIHKKDFQQHVRPYRDSVFEISDAARKSHSQSQQNNQRGNFSLDSKYSPSSSGRSETLTSVRSSFSQFSQAVRSVTSKSRLVSSSGRMQRGTSIDSIQREVVLPTEESFDSWDTSAVDLHSRQIMESASVTPTRLLETIPASPTGSRSPSPGFPLDLLPPQSRARSRSHSPASFRESRTRSRAASPSDSLREAHIHPLFRSDSPTPPPAATRRTVVTAAPGAGQLISDVQSIRSLNRMRSGSLPTSPLMHSDSVDGIRQNIAKEEELQEEPDDSQETQEGARERSLTPPIPDWILGQGSRNSLTNYNARKKSPA